MSAELVLSGAIFIGLALLIPTIMVLTAVLGPRSGGEAKNAPYESGIEQVVGMADQKFSVKFYLLAILFLIFDIEAVFMYPWAVVFDQPVKHRNDDAYPDGTDAEYQSTLFEIFPDMLIKSVLWPTLGNHDAANADSTRARARLSRISPFTISSTLAPIASRSAAVPTNSN